LVVLIIEDEPGLVEVWEQLFLRVGFAVLAASDGAVGIEILRNQQVDVVATDVRMPLADGVEVLEYLENEHKRLLPTFVCSGYVEDEAAALAPYNIARIIRKPFSFQEQLAYFTEFVKGLSLD
jgi:CheY-like chemotaxis protein